jgi:methylmalonyl-CoA/ethylmalonyl-CoA epimerase
MTLDHIGYLTNDIDETARMFVALGYERHETFDFEAQKCSVCFLTKEGETRIELVKPYDENKSLTRILKKTGVAPYHLCYEVEDVEAEIAKPQFEGFVPLFAPVEAPAFGNRKICYLWNQEVGFIELVDMKENDMLTNVNRGGVKCAFSTAHKFRMQTRFLCFHLEFAA